MQCEWDNGRQCPKRATHVFVTPRNQVAACNGHRVATANKFAKNFEQGIVVKELQR